MLGVSPSGNSLRTDDGVVRFVDSNAAVAREGIIGVELATTDPALAGTRTELLGVALRFIGRPTGPT